MTWLWPAACTVISARGPPKLRAPRAERVPPRLLRAGCDARPSQCAREDSNLHDLFGSQGPQPRYAGLELTYVSICRDVPAADDATDANREAFVITAVITPDNYEGRFQLRAVAR
jgi:hypothetical protein